MLDLKHTSHDSATLGVCSKILPRHNSPTARFSVRLGMEAVEDILLGIVFQHNDAEISL